MAGTSVGVGVELGFEIGVLVGVSGSDVEVDRDAGSVNGRFVREPEPQAVNKKTAIERIKIKRGRFI